MTNGTDKDIGKLLAYAESAKDERQVIHAKVDGLSVDLNELKANGCAVRTEVEQRLDVLETPAPQPTVNGLVINNPITGKPVISARGMDAVKIVVLALILLGVVGGFVFLRYEMAKLRTVGVSHTMDVAEVEE